MLAPGATVALLVPDGTAAPPDLRVRRRIPVALAGSRLAVLVLTLR